MGKKQKRTLSTRGLYGHAHGKKNTHTKHTKEKHPNMIRTTKTQYIKMTMVNILNDNVVTKKPKKQTK